MYGRALAAMYESCLQAKERRAHLALRWPHDHRRSGVDDVVAPAHRLLKGPSMLQVGLRCRPDQVLACFLGQPSTAGQEYGLLQLTVGTLKTLRRAAAPGNELR